MNIPDWARYELSVEDEYGVGLDCSACWSAALEGRRAWEESRPRQGSAPPWEPPFRLGRPAGLAEAMSLAREHERLVHGLREKVARQLPVVREVTAGLLALRARRRQ